MRDGMPPGYDAWKTRSPEDEYAMYHSSEDDYPDDDAPEPIDYREAAWLWMSASGSNDASSMRADFAQHTLEHLADAAIHAWNEPLDRDQFIRALENLREDLEQAGDKPGDVA